MFIVINLDNLALVSSTLANQCVIFSHPQHLLDIFNRVFIRFLLLMSILALGKMFQPRNSMRSWDEEAPVAQINIYDLACIFPIPDQPNTYCYSNKMCALNLQLR